MIGRPDRAALSALIDRYDRPGPRYTSYPTAVEFSPEFRAADYAERLELADAAGEAPLSVYMHLPFCEERCLYCGCHVIITSHHHRAEPYLDSLAREVELVAERLPHRRRVAELHLGGGTPTYYSAAQLETLVGRFLERFELAPGAELAIEVDPRATRDEHIDRLGALGFNRLSLGVQDFTREVQERVHRVQSVDETARLIARARGRGFGGINIDLIYGLPRQTPESFERTVEAVIALGPDRVAAYSFAYVPWLRAHQKDIRPEELPAREVKLELLALTRERLIDAGFEAIGMDHFARREDELSVARRERRLRRNFMGYAVVPGLDVLGFGLSAIGDVHGAFIQNEKKLSRYTDAVEASRLPVERGLARSADDELRRSVIEELMCNMTIDVSRLERERGFDFASTFAPDLELLAAYEREGLVSIRPERIEAQGAGELFVRNLAMCFDRYLRERHADSSRPVFSRTV